MTPRTPRAPQTPILTYHAVAETADARFAPFAVTPRELNEQVAWLAAQGRPFLTVGAYARSLRARAGPAPGAVVLTFDDGFRDFLTQALPILNRHGAVATLFVTSGHLDATARWLARQGEGGRPMLAAADLPAVHEAGIEIGAHSHTHPELDRLPREALAREVALCKEVLEGHLGAEVGSFAYPFGYHDARVRRAVRRAGYRAACEVRHLMSSGRDDPYALRRRIVPRGLPPARFRELVDRPDGPVDRAVREAREVGARVLRRARAPLAGAS